MVRLAAALAAIALGASGCGKTTIDAGKAEKFVRGAIGPPAPRSVHCPGGVEAKKGRTLTCTAMLADGKRYAVTLHVLDNSRVALGPNDVRPAPIPGD